MKWIVLVRWRGQSFGEGYGGEEWATFAIHEEAESYIDEQREEHRGAEEFTVQLWRGDRVR